VHFLGLIQAPQLNQRSEQSASYAFVTIVGFVIHSIGPYWFDESLSATYSKMTQTVSVRKLVDKLLSGSTSSHNFFLTQNFNYNFGFFAKTIVRYCSHKNDVSMTSIAGSRKICLYCIYKTTLLQNLISSLTVHTFKPHFVRSCKMDINLY